MLGAAPTALAALAALAGPIGLAGAPALVALAGALGPAGALGLAGTVPGRRAGVTVVASKNWRPGTGLAWPTSPVSACCAGVACAPTLGIITVSRPR